MESASARKPVSYKDMWRLDIDSQYLTQGLFYIVKMTSIVFMMEVEEMRVSVLEAKTIVNDIINFTLKYIIACGILLLEVSQL